VAACGICGTDLHIADGEFAPTLPVTPGHEFAGEVVAVGTAVDAAVDGVRVGDQVAVDPSLVLRRVLLLPARPRQHVRAVAGHRRDGHGRRRGVRGGPVANCVVLPGDVRPVDAALVEPLSCAVHGFDVLAPALGDHYLIYGAGTMGLMMMELAKRAGAASVSMVDLNPARLATARELGCSAAVGSADELDRPRGWDNVIDCTGVVAAIEDGLPRVIKGGTFQQFGVANEDATARFNPFVVYNQEIRIIGSMAVLHSFDRARRSCSPRACCGPDVMISDSQTPGRATRPHWSSSAPGWAARSR
jgi:threonine dehydrogenase-like Zn-dependent dehydrogenase